MIIAKVSLGRLIHLWNVLETDIQICNGNQKYQLMNYLVSEAGFHKIILQIRLISFLQVHLQLVRDHRQISLLIFTEFN